MTKLNRRTTTVLPTEMTKGRGDRGKVAEKAVQKLLDRYNHDYSDFAYHRLPDARAAGGRLAAQPADFIYWSGDYGGFIEVKETEHEYRLAKDKISQLAILKKFSMAGARSIVLVFHSTLKKWRIAKVEYFELGVPSWDLSGLPLHDSADDAMNSISWR